MPYIIWYKQPFTYNLYHTQQDNGYFNTISTTLSHFANILPYCGCKMEEFISFPFNHSIIALGKFTPAS